MRGPTLLRSSTLAACLLALAACGGGGNDKPKVQQQVITPCDGVTTPAPGLTPAIVPAFDVWQAIVVPPTVRFTATFVPTSRTRGAMTPTPVPTVTPRNNILAVSVDTADAGTATQFRLTVACQGTVVVPETFTIYPPDSLPMECAFAPQSGVDVCPSAEVNLNDFGFANLRRLGCLVEIGPGQPLGFGMCTDPDRARYKLTITLNNQAVQSLTLAAHNCRAPASCLHDVFGIAIPATPTPTPSS